jgi:type IV pilus assembly protein PilB
VKCKNKIEIHSEALRELDIPGEQPFDIFEPVGCPSCSGTGYSGRLGLYEVMPVSEEIRQMILDRCSSTEIKDQAVREGMLTLRADGITKLKEGITSLAEVLKETTNK